MRAALYDLPHLGDFVTLPSGAFGCVMGSRWVRLPRERTMLDVLLQADPDQPADQWRWHRLAPGAYTID